MKSIKYLGWDYIIDDESEPKFRVAPLNSENYDDPKLLFKIFAVTEYSVGGLENQELYASYPERFNDPFDSHYQMLKLDDEELKKRITSEVPPEYLKGKDASGQMFTLQQYFQELFFQYHGIICLTGNPSHIPMWAYYGQEHKGFMVQYEVSKMKISGYGPFPMNYQEKIEPFSVSGLGEDYARLIQTNLKHKDWEHENEWRFIAKSQNSMKTTYFKSGSERTFKYDRTSVKMICLGYNFFHPDEKESIGDGTMIINFNTGSPFSKDQLLKIRILKSIILNN